MPKLHQMCGFLCANNAGVLGGTKKRGGNGGTTPKHN